MAVKIQYMSLMPKDNYNIIRNAFEKTLKRGEVCTLTVTGYACTLYDLPV